MKIATAHGVREEPYGLAIAACRDAGDDHNWRINQFRDALLHARAADEPVSRPQRPRVGCRSTTRPRWRSCSRNTRRTHSPRRSSTRSATGSGGAKPATSRARPAHSPAPPPTLGPFGRYWPTLRAENDYGYDERLEASHFSAIPSVDPGRCVPRGMGPIVDRSLEHLGSSDAGILRMRRAVLDAATALRERLRPLTATDPSVPAVTRRVAHPARGCGLVRDVSATASRRRWRVRL